MELDLIDTINNDRDFSIYKEKLINHFMGKGWTVERAEEKSKIYLRAITLFRDFIED